MFTEQQVKNLKIIFVGLISVLTIFFIWYQDYMGVVSLLTLASTIGMTIWGAVYCYKKVPFDKLIILAILAMLIGFLTEFIGSHEGLWNFGLYNPPYYIITGWVLLSLTMLMLTELSYESKYVPSIPTSQYDPYIGAFTPVLLLIFLVSTLGAYRTDAGFLFYAYYLGLTIINGLYYYRHPDNRKLVLAIIAAWIVGLLAEVIGAESALWVFSYGFPTWIVISGWSLEWLVILAGVKFVKDIVRHNSV